MWVKMKGGSVVTMWAWCDMVWGYWICAVGNVISMRTELICLLGYGQWAHVINAYCMLDHSHIWLSLPCAAERDRGNVDFVACPKGRSKHSSLCCWSVLTHFITSLFLSFFLSLSPRSILEKCRRQSSRHFCIYFLLLFIHDLAHQQHSWGKCICHTNSAPLIYLIPFFHGSLFKGSGTLEHLKTWLGWGQESGTVKGWNYIFFNLTTQPSHHIFAFCSLKSCIIIFHIIVLSNAE